MGIMDIFRSNPQQVQQPQQQVNQNPGAGQPGNIPPQNAPTTNQTAATAPNGAVPIGADQASNNTQTPLDQFGDLFKIDPNAQQQNANTPIFNVDPQKMMEAAGKVNFAQVVTPEILNGIQAGGEAGAQALITALNSVSQQVYAQSAIASTKLIEQAIGKARESFTAEIPDIIKAKTLDESMRNTNPAFSHPAAQPVVQMIQENLRLKHPNATVQELQQLAQNYFQSLGAAFTPNQQQQQNSQKPGEVDWSTFLS